MELARGGAPEGTTVVADEQTAGRGRRDRRWFSPRGEGLYHSIILRPSIPPESAPLLTLLAAVGLSDTLRSGYHIESDIKWPNDVLIQGRKCAGILLEMEPRDREVGFVILGIGVNLNQRGFPPEVAPGATSLFLEIGRDSNVEEFRERLFEQMADGYEAFQAAGPRWVIDQWMERSTYAEGRAVWVELGRMKLSGTTCEIGRAHV